MNAPVQIAATRFEAHASDRTRAMNLSSSAAAGAPTPPRIFDVASFRRNARRQDTIPERDADLMAEFAEFMRAGEGADDAVDLDGGNEPDPIFREQLRRRLWRTRTFLGIRSSDDTRLH